MLFLKCCIKYAIKSGSDFF
uniref:Uncharacterized protein n=1 Tax=Lepeophtheirus salmonis TaxID=72036 RepID=A0A0K2V1E6_LEPSM